MGLQNDIERLFAPRSTLPPQVGVSPNLEHSVASQGHLRFRRLATTEEKRRVAAIVRVVSHLLVAGVHCVLPYPVAKRPLWDIEAF